MKYFMTMYMYLLVQVKSQYAHAGTSVFIRLYYFTAKEPDDKKQDDEAEEKEEEEEVHEKVNDQGI